MPADSARPNKQARTIEFTVVFVILPLLLYAVRLSIKHLIIPGLLVFSALCLVILLRDPTFSREKLWNASAAGLAPWRPILKVFIPGALVLLLFFALSEPERLWSFPRRTPLFWLLVMAFYPLLSVYPQELIYRTFLMHRYRHLFGERTIVWVSGMSFGLAHLFFANPFAPILTAAGGVLFARTYHRTGSTFWACVEHSLWGDFLFTLGMGWYFYGGSIT